MGEKLDINFFYMTEYICSECANICSKADVICPACGKQKIGRNTVCKSCLDYRICTEPDCVFVTHEEVSVCPICGGRTRGCTSLIPEDHWGLPVPPQGDCSGSLSDDDVGFEYSRQLADCVKRKKDM